MAQSAHTILIIELGAYFPTMFVLEGERCSVTSLCVFWHIKIQTFISNLNILLSCGAETVFAFIKINEHRSFALRRHLCCDAIE